jgi:hypothetical protein
MLPAG